MGTGDILLGVTLQWTSIPSSGGVAILSVASCYRNQGKLRPCGPPWLVCHFITTFATFSTVNRKIGERSAFFPSLQIWRYCSREGKGYEEELQRRWNFAGRSCSCCRLLPFSTIGSLNVGVLITYFNFNFQFYFKISYISGLAHK